MTDTKSLRELAERALTDWPVETGREQPIWQAMRVLKPIANPETHYGAGIQSDFITHANPAAILALLDENARLAAQNQRAEARIAALETEKREAHAAFEEKVAKGIWVKRATDDATATDT